MDELKILGLVIAMNAGLSVLSNALGYIKDKTKSDVDNKLFDLVGRLMGFSQKVVDFIGYNPKH